MRNLNREIANVSRKVARKVVTEGKNVAVEVTPANLNDYLGILKYRDFLAEKKNEIGLTTGLAWTEVGGEVLSTEATLMQGKGRLTLTGKLGDVMQESAQAAHELRSFAQPSLQPAQGFLPPPGHSHARSGRRDPEGRPFGRHHDLHLDRQRADRIPVRCDIAMTGEITLRGKVLPIGGVKEKLLAAHRLGLRTVILPKDNEKDLADIPPDIQAQMSIHFVESMDEVLQIALEHPLADSRPPAGCRSRAQVRRGRRAGQRIDQLKSSGPSTFLISRLGPRPEVSELSVRFPVS